MLLLGIALYREGRYDRAEPLLLRAPPPPATWRRAAGANIFLGAARRRARQRRRRARSLRLRRPLADAAARRTAMALLSAARPGRVTLIFLLPAATTPTRRCSRSRQDPVERQAPSRATTATCWRSPPPPRAHVFACGPGFNPRGERLVTAAVPAARARPVLQSSLGRPATSTSARRTRLRRLRVRRRALAGSLAELSHAAQVGYRRALYSDLGASLHYQFNYRGYRLESLAPFTGPAHAATVELGWGTAERPYEGRARLPAAARGTPRTRRSPRSARAPPCARARAPPPRRPGARRLGDPPPLRSHRGTSSAFDTQLYADLSNDRRSDLLPGGCSRAVSVVRKLSSVDEFDYVKVAADAGLSVGYAGL